jgi:hypothetical protein
LLDDETGVLLPAYELESLPGALVEVGRTLDVSDEARIRRAAAVAHCTPERFAADLHRAAELGLRVRSTRWRGPSYPRRSGR